MTRCFVPVDDWKAFLRRRMDKDEVAALRRHERTGRPLGGERFMDRVERLLSRTLKPRKPGRPAAKTSESDGAINSLVSPDKGWMTTGGILPDPSDRLTCQLSCLSSACVSPL